MTYTFRMFSILFAAFLVSFSGFSQTIDPVLADQWKTREKAPVMILMQEQADLSQAKLLRGKLAKTSYVFERLNAVADRSQARVRAYLKGEGIDFTPFWAVNMISADLTRKQADDLSSFAEIASFLPVLPIEQIDTEIRQPLQSRTPQAVPWGIDMVRAPEVWLQGITGKGVVIGGQDTGTKWDTKAIKEQYRGNLTDTVVHDYNWYDAIHEIDTVNHNDSIVMPSNNPCGLNSKVPCDDNGHGTLTLGTAIGLDEEADEQIGMAPGAEWISCRCMERGYGTPVTYTECFQFFLAPTDVNGDNPRPEMAPDVINNSWACPPMEGCHPGNFQVMEIVVNNLRAAGIVVVVSAGNTGPGCGSVSTPAAIFSSSFAVGATASNDTIWRGSSRGPVLVDGSGRLKPDITAPGVRIRTCWPDDSYRDATGTSLAGPHVAGLVALILEARPELAGEVDVIEEIIKMTAEAKPAEVLCGNDMLDSIPNNTYGYGRIDAFRAVEYAKIVGSAINGQDRSLEMAIFPNPFVNEFRIWRKDFYEAGQLWLTDPLGRTMKYTVPPGEEFFTIIAGQDMPSGHYYYRIIQDGKTGSGKLVRID